jgi:hypothetical protein
VAVGYSLNLANFVWAEGLDFYVKNGGRLTPQAPVSVVEDAEELGRGLLKALTIQEYYRQRLSQPVSGPLAVEEFWPPAGAAGGQLTLSLSPPPDSALGPGDLGRVRIPCPSLDSNLCQARLSAVRGLLTDLSAPAQGLANLNLKFEDLPGDQLGRAVLAYQGAIEPYLAAEENQAQAALTKELTTFSNQAKENGWLMAGAYYWTITGYSRKAGEELYQSVSFSGGEAKALEGEVLSDFEPVLARYERYMDEAYVSARTLGARGTLASFPSLEWFNDKISGALGRYGLDRLTSHLAKGDPMTTLASLGH